jgi:polar amino acid transport system ATP-binding protein
VSDIILEIKQLSKSFDRHQILRNISLSVRKGELVSIIGRSGCGKTTLLRCINCLEHFDSGYLRVDGIEIERGDYTTIRNGQSNNNTRRLSNGKKRKLEEEYQEKAYQIRSRVGLLFQNLNLFPHLTVLENITIAPQIVRKEHKSLAIARAKELLEKVGLSGFEKRYPYQLSGGQAQRVAIARALAMNPELMLYDEPTSALDPELVGEVFKVMQDLHREGMTQIIVTHAMNFAKSASDYVIYLEEGEIVEIGKPDILFSAPQDPRTEAYVRLFKE